MSDSVYAVIMNDLVINVIVWDGTNSWTPSQSPNALTVNALPAGSPVSIGYTWDGTNYWPPGQQGTGGTGTSS
jgi:hypothetical protein